MKTTSAFSFLLFLLASPLLFAASNIEQLSANAEKGDAASMYRLAQAYATGKEVPKDVDQALKWLLMAGEHNNLKALENLAGLFFRGSFVPYEFTELKVQQDFSEAYRWYRKAAHLVEDAAKNGDVAAQYKLGRMYEKMAASQNQMKWGSGELNLREAAFWFLKAASKGHRLAQLNISSQYLFGKGVPQSEVEGAAWEIIYAAGEQDNDLKEEAMDGLKRTELHIGPDKMRMAKQRSKEILAEIEAAQTNKNSAQSSTDASVVSDASPKFSGSGAIVSVEGLVLTAAHVVAGATKVTVVTTKGAQDAVILRIDESNDVAVLKIDGGPYVSLPIVSSRRVRLGQAVATIGFPNIGIQGFSPKVTRGEISSLNGAMDDPRSWQISVPVQPGNSGGPLLDETGNLIGIVVSKLGIKATVATGDIPQNVNYALKSTYALALLESYLDSKALEPNPPNQKQAFADMVSGAQQSVVLILAY